MLYHLHVKDLALIESEEVEFGEGMNILTGETGAGKSILIGSINLCLGSKANKDMIRNGYMVCHGVRQCHIVHNRVSHKHSYIHKVRNHNHIRILTVLSISIYNILQTGTSAEFTRTQSPPKSRRQHYAH